MGPEKFEPLNPNELEIFPREKLPALVLAVYKYKLPWGFTAEREWIGLNHKAGGFYSVNHPMIATILKQNPEVIPKIGELSDKWGAKNFQISCMDYSGKGEAGESLYHVPFTFLERYRSDLDKLLGITSHHNYWTFMEGLFPFDNTFENYSKLTSEELPTLLDDLIDWPDDNTKKNNLLNVPWRWFILGVSYATPY